jgi:hypothetical protein
VTLIAEQLEPSPKFMIIVKDIQLLNRWRIFN